MRFLSKNAGFLSYGLLLAGLSSFGQTYFIGVYVPDISRTFDLSNSEFGLYYLLITIGSAVGLNRLGHVIDRVRLEPYTLALLLLMALACAAVGLADSFAFLVVALTAARLMGQGMLTHAAMTSMSRYFDRNRGLAVAIAGLGFPLGQALLPPLAIFLMQSMSWQESWLFFALALLLVALPVVMALLTGHHRRHAAWTSGSGAATEADGVGGPHLRRRDVLRDRRFYMMLPALIAGPFWITAVFFFAAELAQFKAISREAYTGYYGFYALGSVAAPFLGGLLVDRFGGRHLLPSYPPLFALALLLIVVLAGDASVIAFMMLLGLGAGITLPINNAVWAELYGTRYLGEIKSLSTSIVVVSTALAPYLFGLALDAGIGLGPILTAGAAFCLAATLLVVPVAARS